MMPKDLEFLKAARASNGGGVDSRKFPLATLHRLTSAKFVAPKKGNVTSVPLYVITKEGREFLERIEIKVKCDTAKTELKDAQVRDDGSPPWEL